LGDFGYLDMLGQLKVHQKLFRGPGDSEPSQFDSQIAAIFARTISISNGTHCQGGSQIFAKLRSEDGE
jgi:hypothetical protein